MADWGSIEMERTYGGEMRWAARAIALIATGALGVTGVACGVGNSQRMSTGPTHCSAVRCELSPSLV
jgi:hypothetical protein